MTIENIEKLKNYYKENNFKVNGMKLRKWYQKNPQILNEINQLLNQYPNLTNKTNIVYCLVHDISLDSLKCKVCGKFLKIIHITQLPIYCSSKCQFTDEELKQKKKDTIKKDLTFYKRRTEKIQKTNLQKYGTKTPAESDIIKQKMKQTFSKDPDIWKKRYQKTKETSLKKYGVENASSTKEVRNKVKKTCLQKYGVDNINKLPETLNKIKKTCLQKYGVDCQFKRKDIIQKNLKKSWNNILSWYNYVIPLFTFEEYTGYNKSQIYKWKCSKCGNQFQQNIYHTKISSISQLIPRCPICFPIHIGSYKEIQLFEFIKQYFPNAQHNNRQIISPNELDIVIPEKHLAFEFNGIYWHSDSIKNDINYHLNKTLETQKAGYKLIHIWQNDWINKNDLIKRKIKALLGINQENIYARKCIVKQINTKQKNQFLNINHIQGEDKSKIKLGLFYQNQLVAVMTFGKPRFNKKYQWQLIRYATSKHVIGGAGKLLKYFQKKFNPKNLITYADRCYSQGNMYRKIGFNELKPSGPSYVWIDNNNVFSRHQCQKHKLKNILGNKFDQNLSEDQNMKFNGFCKIYDCGNLIFEKIY